MATLIKEEFEAALATVSPSLLEDHTWISRVDTWEKVNDYGITIAALFRSNDPEFYPRQMAPDFYDYIMSIFPASGDAAVYARMKAEEDAHVEAGRRSLGLIDS